jgi:ribonucleoside-diphosphate reductase alpha chain
VDKKKLFVPTEQGESELKSIDPELLKFGAFASTTIQNKYAQYPNVGDNQTWVEIATRVAESVMKAVPASREMIDELAYRISIRQIIPGGRYLYAAGRDYHQVQNCLLMRAEDSREGWSELLYNSSMALMSGAGIGIEYSKVRERGALISRTGGRATGPCSPMQMVNEAGRHIRQGGSRRSAIWAGLGWDHQDIKEFIHIKDWTPEVKALKAKDFDFPAPMDGTNVSVRLDDEFFKAYHDPSHPKHAHAQDVYWDTVRQMLMTGEPGFSIDTGENSGETLRNACTEVSSYTDSDICNLLSINLARIHTLADMQACVELSTAFLVAGTEYSHVPFDKVLTVREANRRLGLGLMGIHEWLLARGKVYGPDNDLAEYLKIYEQSTYYAHQWEQKWSLSKSVKTRAIAPTGTIGIIAETTTGCEPLFCSAYKRRYLNGSRWEYQYVIDPIAKRLIDSGTKPDKLEDAYTLAINPSRRVDFQVWLQKYVDHGISSTINLPAWGTEYNNEDKVKDFGNMLIERLPYLRGITCYPDGARSGQPLNVVSYQTAIKHEGQIFYEQGDVCDFTKGGTCGS